MAIEPIELSEDFNKMLAQALRQVPLVQAALLGVLEGRQLAPSDQFELVIDAAHLEPTSEPPETVT